jgi:hypothetical protein
MFDKIAGDTGIPNGAQFIVNMEKWAAEHLSEETLRFDRCF